MTEALEKAGFKNIIFYYESNKSLNKDIEHEIVDYGMSHSICVEAKK
jgi:hypothetical protein